MPDILCEQPLLGIHLSPAAHGGRDQGLDHHPLLGPALLHGAGQAQVNVGDDMLHGDIAELQGEGLVGQQPASVPLGDSCSCFIVSKRVSKVAYLGTEQIKGKRRRSRGRIKREIK